MKKKVDIAAIVFMNMLWRYSFNPNYWGKGYATEAAKAIMTTDTCEKQIAVEIEVDPDGYVEAAKKIRYIEEEELNRITGFLYKMSAIISEMAYDRYVAPGTQYAFYGAGVEFYPIKSLKNLLRVHAFVYGNNAKGAQAQVLSFNLGIRWQMKVFQR